MARAPITVRPEKVIDSPTLHSEKATASWTSFPVCLLPEPEDEEQPVSVPAPSRTTMSRMG